MWVVVVAPAGAVVVVAPPGAVVVVAPVGAVVDVVGTPVGAVVEVVGTHGTVVVTGLLGMHGGSVVDDVGTPVVFVPSGVLVVVPGAMVVVVVGDTAVVVVVPGVGPLAHPKDCSNDVRMAVTPGISPKVPCKDRRSWHTGSRSDASSWVPTGPPVV